MGADGQRGEFEWLARNVAAVPLGRGTFAYRSGRRLVFFGNQQFAQCVNVAAQHRQGTIPLKANFALVATTDESVARLQGANCRLDARVTLPGLMKRDRRGFGLFQRLLFARFRETDMDHDFGELLLVFGRMKAAIEREFFDAIVETLL